MFNVENATSHVIAHCGITRMAFYPGNLIPFEPVGDSERLVDMIHFIPPQRCSYCSRPKRSQFEQCAGCGAFN
jgi:hypothetical protein